MTSSLPRLLRCFFWVCALGVVFGAILLAWAIADGSSDALRMGLVLIAVGVFGLVRVPRWRRWLAARRTPPAGAGA